MSHPWFISEGRIIPLEGVWSGVPKPPLPRTPSVLLSSHSFGRRWQVADRRPKQNAAGEVCPLPLSSLRAVSWRSVTFRRGSQPAVVTPGSRLASRQLSNELCGRTLALPTPRLVSSLFVLLSSDLPSQFTFPFRTDCMLSALQWRNWGFTTR